MNERDQHYNIETMEKHIEILKGLGKPKRHAESLVVAWKKVYLKEFGKPYEAHQNRHNVD